MNKVIFLILGFLVVLAGCNNGSSGGAAPTPPPAVSIKKTFIYGMDLTGDLKTNGNGATGVDGADKLCQGDAQSSGGTYKALVVDGVHRVACSTANCSGGISEHIDWVLQPNTKYVRIDGTTEIGTTDSKGLLQFPLANEFIFQSYDLWTGLNTNWTTSSDNCSGFASDQTFGQTGYSNTKDVEAISNRNYVCSYYGISIMCVEQ